MSEKSNAALRMVETLDDAIRDILDICHGWTRQLSDDEKLRSIERIAAAAILHPARERVEDPGENASEPDPPGLAEAQREIMKEHGFPASDWKPVVPSQLANRRTCPECGRDLHGYRGPRCRYCDPRADCE